jgi:hypothetical protein
MSSLLKKILLICMLSFVLLNLFYLVIISCCKRTYTSFQKNEEYFRSDLTYDVLLLGSSRMQHTVNPMMLDKVLYCTSYNAGAEGATIAEINMLLKAGLRLHPKPKMVIVSLDFSALDVKKKFNFYPVYLPYADIPEVKESLQRQGIPTTFYAVFPFMKLTEMDDYYKGAIIKVVTGAKSRASTDVYYKGFESNTSISVSPDKISSEENAASVPGQTIIPVTDEGISALNDIVRTCGNSQIELVFLYSPEYNFRNQRTIRNFSAIMHLYDSVAIANNIRFLRHDSLPICSEAKYFANPGHLNKNGADVYSTILGEQLKAQSRSKF